MSAFFFLISFIYFSSSLLFFIEIDAKNRTKRNVPTLEDLFPLNPVRNMENIAEQFGQNPDWETEALPINLSEQEETRAHSLEMPRVYPSRKGIEKSGNLFYSQYSDPYIINRQNINPYSSHHVFFVRHGLYYYTEDDPSSHLLRYGKFQARMAGQKIDQAIRRIIQQNGPLTRPISLVSSTQTRAYETLYNIRLQLGDDLNINPDIILDSGLTECTNPQIQLQRWLYFVQEYLQPKRTNRRENYITIISAHGNLLSSFHHIIENVLTRSLLPEASIIASLPPSTTLLHAQVMLYVAVGTRPLIHVEKIRMAEIPITINHAHLEKDIYYEWATKYGCRSQHGRENMNYYIRIAILDKIFGCREYGNARHDFIDIVYQEMVQEYEKHLLPMMMFTCRHYLARLPLLRPNIDVLRFNRQMSPEPIPEPHEISRPFSQPYFPFSGFALPFRIDSDIFRIDDNDASYFREIIQKESVHPDSRSLAFLIRSDKFLLSSFFLFFIITCFSLLRLNINKDDLKTSHLTRVGINQLRGAGFTIYNYLQEYLSQYPDLALQPITFLAEPTVYAAESCILLRDLLESVNYTVNQVVVEFALKWNVHHSSYRSVEDPRFFQYRYLLNKYWKPMHNNGQEPVAQIYVMCGEGVLFLDFIDALVKLNLAQPPSRPYRVDKEYMSHANFFVIEAIGHEQLIISELYSLRTAKSIIDDFKLDTFRPIELSEKALRKWLKDPRGPCSLQFYIENKSDLVNDVITRVTDYKRQLHNLLRQEWYPYLAGMFIYACRVQLTKIYGPRRSRANNTVAADATVTVTVAAAAAAVNDGAGESLEVEPMACGNDAEPSTVPKDNGRGDCI